MGSEDWPSGKGINKIGCVAAIDLSDITSIPGVLVLGLEGVSIQHRIQAFLQ